MLRYQDFVPKMVKPAAFLSPAEHESFEAALAEANSWIKENEIRVVSVETVVLPNIWSRYEEGTGDAGPRHQRRLPQLLAPVHPRVVRGGQAGVARIAARIARSAICTTSWPLDRCGSDSEPLCTLRSRS